jgi:hypothetical protein
MSAALAEGLSYRAARALFDVGFRESYGRDIPHDVRGRNRIGSVNFLLFSNDLAVVQK